MKLKWRTLSRSARQSDEFCVCPISASSLSSSAVLFSPVTTPSSFLLNPGQYLWSGSSAANCVTSDSSSTLVEDKRFFRLSKPVSSRFCMVSGESFAATGPDLRFGFEDDFESRPESPLRRDDGNRSRGPSRVALFVNRRRGSWARFGDAASSVRMEHKRHWPRRVEMGSMPFERQRRQPWNASW